MDANNSASRNPYPDPTAITGKLEWEKDDSITAQIREESSATDKFIDALMSHGFPHEAAVNTVRVLIEAGLQLATRKPLKRNGENVEDEKIGTSKLSKQEQRGVGAFMAGMFITGFVVRRYMKKRIPQLIRIDLLTEDKILATFTRGNPIVLSRVVEP
jgi:hypothetical protein